MRIAALFLGVVLIPHTIWAQSATTTTFSLVTLSELITHLRQPTAEEILRAFTPAESTGIVDRLEALLKAQLIVASTTSSATSTESATSTDAETVSLLEQIAAVQQQILDITGGSTTPVSVGATSSLPVIACPLIDRTLSYGSTGTDVTNLQLFLIGEHMLDAGNSTGFFGKLTEAAVQSWQSAKGIVSDGTPETTGWGVVGPRTRAALALCR